VHHTRKISNSLVVFAELGTLERMMEHQESGLSIQEQSKRFAHLDKWFSSSHGKYVAKAIAEELSHVKDFLSGERLIQLGGSVDKTWLSELRFQHQSFVTPQIKSTAQSFASSMNQLPIDRECIDCIIAPFLIDGFVSKESVIDELDRILKPMGYIVFFGVNPISLWGLWLKFSGHNFFGPLKGFPKSVIALKCMMLQRGYSQSYCSEFYFIPPVRQKSTIKAFSFLNQVGKMISPTPSAFYCLVMQKRVDNYIGPILIENKKEFLKSSPACQPV
jgi:hypothetical protein